MAPRRGSSSSSSGGGNGINNQCTEYDAFQSNFSKAQIGVLGGFLFLFLVLWFCACSSATKRKKNNKTHSILHWYQWGLAIFFVVTLFVLTIIRFVLSECGIFYYNGSQYTSIGLAILIISSISDLFLLAIILFTVTLSIFTLSASKRLKLVFTLIYSIFFAVLCVIVLAWLVLYGIITYGRSSSRRSSILISYSKLLQAQAILYFIVSIFAVIGLIIAWIRLSRNPPAKKGVVGWIPALCLCIFGYAIYAVITILLSVYNENYYERPEATIAGWAVSLLLFFGAYLSIYMISRGEGWDYMGAAIAHDLNAPPPTTQFAGVYDPVNFPERNSYAHPQSPTSVPPYAGTTYSGNGQYQPQGMGQVYSPGGWNSGGYAPVQQVPTVYSAPKGAASYEQNELVGRR